MVYKDREGKEYLWEYLGYLTKAEKSGSFVRQLQGKELDRHEKNKEKADELFILFKKEFTEKFPKSKAITARINLYGSQIYFYFFADDRYDFSEFVRTFREKIDLKFFIYQVWARDRIRLHPHIDEWYDANGLPLMYSVFKHPLDQVDSDVVQLQWLRGRDNERLKDRSGKLDHTLAFEADIYEQENKKYPRKSKIISIDGKKMMCTGYNILTQEIKLRWEDPEKPWEFYGEYMSISLDEYEKVAKTVAITTPKTKKLEKQKSTQVTKKQVTKKQTQKKPVFKKRSSWFKKRKELTR